MAGEKNFIIKNGLTVGNVEVIDSSGNITASGVGAAVQEAIADKIGGIIQGSGSTTVTYDDTNDTITISSTGKTEEEIQDIVGAQLVTNGTHTNITASYDDIGDGAIDLSISDAVIQSKITAGTGVSISSGAVSIGQAVGTTDSPSFAGLTLTGNQTITGHILPSLDNTYDLGSSTKTWKDVYVGPGSLYVNGQQVVSDSSGTIVVSADLNQNVSVQTSGSGDVELDPTGTGIIQLKGTVQVTAGETISSSDGNAIQFSNAIDVDAIESRSANTNLVLTGNGTGNVTVNDNLNITGDLTVSGTTTTVNSETINLADNIIALNSNFTSGVPTENSGISITRGGSTAKTLLWDETNDKWTVGSDTFVAGTFEGALTGNVTGNVTGTVSSIANHDTDSLSEGASNLYFTNARADARVNAVLPNTDSLTEGTSNLYFTNERVDDRVNALVTAGTGITSTYDDVNGTLTLATTITQYADSNARGAISVTDSGGDGSLAYNSTTGVITYTGPSASETRAHFSGGTGVSISSGSISIGQAVSTSSNVEFTQITTNYANNAGGVARNIHQSTSTPLSTDGAVGDLWIYYA